MVAHPARKFLTAMDCKIHTGAKIPPFDHIMSEVNVVHTLAIFQNLILLLLLLCSPGIGLPLASYLVTFRHKLRRYFSFCVGAIRPPYLTPLYLIILTVFSETYK
jgi:hypothetical protein